MLSDRNRLFFSRVFHNCVRWWFSTGVWVTASLLKSSGVFSVFWTVSTRPVISTSSGSCTNRLWIVSRAPITIGIIVTFMFNSFYNFQTRSWYLSLFSHSFNFTLWYAGIANFTALQVLSFLLIIIRSGRLAEIKWSFYISKSQTSLCISFSSTDSGLCLYHLFVWSNFNFLHNSQWIILPTQSCLVLYSSCANLQHSLILWLIVSSLSPHNQHLLFCCVLSILTLIWLVLMALFWAAIRRDSISWGFLFLATSTFSRVRCRLLVA